MELPICPLCGRPVEGRSSKHHLVPKSKGGKHEDTVLMHHICHNKIHSLFTEREIQVHYNTIDKLMANEEIQRFVKWVSKKPNDFYDGSAPRKR
ncbi:MAG: HNH endonuclease [Chitinophagales bacterium]